MLIDRACGDAEGGDAICHPLIAPQLEDPQDRSMCDLDVPLKECGPEPCCRNSAETCFHELRVDNEAVVEELDVNLDADLDASPAHPRRRSVVASCYPVIPCRKWDWPQ